MSDCAAVQQSIARWFLETLNLEIPSPDMDLFEAGVLDSLAFVELMLFLENAFGITITLEQVEIEHFKSIERIAAFLLDGAGAVHAAGGAEERVTR